MSRGDACGAHFIAVVVRPCVLWGQDCGSCMSSPEHCRDLCVLECVTLLLILQPEFLVSAPVARCPLANKIGG